MSQDAEGTTIELPNREFGRYTLLEELGRGAQGVVYLAEDKQLHRKVALKTLGGGGAQSKEARERFHREAEIASKLDHPGICGVYELGEENGIPFIAMQFLPGRSLADLLADAVGGGTASGDRASTSLTGKDSMQEVLRIIENSARALHAAHEAGLIHRDIKPANIMVTSEGQPVILDFGLARDMDDHGHTLTETGTIMGTPAYLAAEQILADRIKIDRRTDVYALGTTLYECLTLRRPFAADSFEQLYHQILQGNPPNPRKLNPRIPVDLGTVIEVAMERDQNRRYATALEFAEDLRRVRSFEPIQAKAAGPITRVQKWTRRNPAKAVGVGAITIGVVTVTSLLIAGRIARGQDVRRGLAEAQSHLGSGDFVAALADIRRVTELEPESAEALRIEQRIHLAQERADQDARRIADYAAAAEARQESAAAETEHAEARARVLKHERELERIRGPAFSAYAPLEVRAAVAAQERKLARERIESERLLQVSRESLERAARHEAPWGRSAETEAAFADFFLRRWQEAVDSGDEDRAEMFRSGVERHDPEGKHRNELLGRGQILVSVTPADAELFLFRFESVEAIRDGVAIPRLVPVPTSGIGRTSDTWLGGYQPGDSCLQTTEIAAESTAAAAGLTSGDLIVRVGGQPAGVGLHVLGSRDETAELPPLARIVSVNGTAITDGLDWRTAKDAESGPDRIVLIDLETAAEETAVIDREDLDVATPLELIQRGHGDARLRLDCLHDGIPLEIELPPGEASGIRCERTAFALVCAPANRLHTANPTQVDPGSYLILARAEGHETQRVPILVPRRATVETGITMLEAGSTPPGFVYVPPGPFLFAGDSSAADHLPGEVHDLPAYFIGRREITNREWAAFLEHPETQQRMSESDMPIFVPRDARSGPIPKKNLGGPNTPVMGVSWNDAQGYLEWRNERAIASGEPWVYELPTELEWEKAARGVDGRAFPWGDRFDFAAVIGLHSRARHLYDAPGGFAPFDESPYGVQDMAGHRIEWTADRYVVDPNAPPAYRLRGGSWQAKDSIEFRVASRGFRVADYASGRTGFRLVARPRS